MGTLLRLLPLSLLPALSLGWPDGAPCITSTFDSMNPLEAVEHQGGLQLSEPPYELEVDQRCYWRGQPIAFTLRGKNESVWFKGFAIQPIEWHRDGTPGRRIGRLLRLDDNGSWQYQCFRFKDSVTHSHNQRKKQMKIWWRNDDDETRFVQFVATVVHSQKRFWVKSVLSTPIPPCRVQRDFGPYTPPLPSMPPPVKGFKMETDREFGNFFINEALPNSIQAEEGFGGGSTFTPTFTSFTNSFSTPRPTTSFAFNFQQERERERQRQLEEQRSQQRQREMELERQRQLDESRRVEAERLRFENEQRERARVEAQRRAQQQRGFGTFRPRGSTTSAPTSRLPPPSSTANNDVCNDIDPPSRCLPWAQYCQASSYMHQFCKRTCHFC